MKGIEDNNASSLGNKISANCANAVFEICVSEGLVLDNFSLDLDISKDKVTEVLDTQIPVFCSEEYCQNKQFIVDTIMRSRYVNLYYLLRVSLALHSLFDTRCIIH